VSKKEFITMMGKKIDKAKGVSLETFLLRISTDEKKFVYAFLTDKLEDAYGINPEGRANKTPPRMIASLFKDACRDEKVIREFSEVYRGDKAIFESWLRGSNISTYLSDGFCAKTLKPKLSRLDIQTALEGVVKALGSKLELWDMYGFFEFDKWRASVTVVNFLSMLENHHHPNHLSE